MAKCSEVMTPDPVACEPSDPVKKAARVMKQHDVGAVPVVENRTSRRLIGILTDRDIVVGVVADDRDVNATTVADAMTGNPATCREEDDLRKAVAVMADRKVRRLPVVDGSGRLCGIIAQADIATRLNRDAETGELVEAISEPGTVRK